MSRSTLTGTALSYGACIILYKPLLLRKLLNVSVPACRWEKNAQAGPHSQREPNQSTETSRRPQICPSGTCESSWRKRNAAGWRTTRVTRMRAGHPCSLKRHRAGAGLLHPPAGDMETAAATLCRARCACLYWDRWPCMANFADCFCQLHLEPMSRWPVPVPCPIQDLE